MRTILLLNAPPRSGKDTVANMICEAYDHTTRNRDARIPCYDHLKYSAPIKDALAEFFKLTTREIMDFETDKQTPSPRLLGDSWRGAQINFAERYARVVYGRNAFAQLLSQQLLEGPPNTVVSDCGFLEELQAFDQPVFDGDRVLVVHINREGCDFSNDSRDWVGENLPMWKGERRLVAGDRVRTTLVNNSSCIALHGSVMRMMESIHE